MLSALSKQSLNLRTLVFVNKLSFLSKNINFYSENGKGRHFTVTLVTKEHPVIGRKKSIKRLFLIRFDETKMYDDFFREYPIVHVIDPENSYKLALLARFYNKM